MKEPPTSPLTSRLGLAQVCVAGILWGTGGLVVAVLHQRDGMSAATASAWRMLFAALALTAFVSATRRYRNIATAMRTHPVIVIVLGCGTALYQALYFAAVLMVGVSIATVVSLGLAPILATVWEHVIARSSPSIRDVAVPTAALCGLALVTGGTAHAATSADDSRTLGLVLAVSAGAIYAATTVLGHSVARRIEPAALTTCTTAAGALLLAPFLVVPLMHKEPVFPSDLPSVALLIYLGVVTMALSYGLLYAGLRTTHGSAATVATLLEPLSASALAALFLHERPSWGAVAGGFLILSAVVALRPINDRPQPT